MKVSIWSDVRCPFCYIGKKKFEDALEQFPNKDKVEIVWKSFQLGGNAHFSKYAEFTRLSRDLEKLVTGLVSL